MRLLEPEYLEEDGPITVFFEYKRFSTEFFDKWTNKIEGSLINATVENSETVLTYLFSLETAFKCMKVLVCLKKILENVVIESSSSTCPGSISRTVSTVDVS